MKRVEEKHEEGIQRNLVLAQQMGWHQISRRHGRPLIDPYVRSPTVVSAIAEVIAGILVAVSVPPVLMLGSWFALASAFPELLMWPGINDATLGTGRFVTLWLVLAVTISVGLVLLRLKKARVHEDAAP